MFLGGPPKPHCHRQSFLVKTQMSKLQPLLSKLSLPWLLGHILIVPKAATKMAATVAVAALTLAPWSAQWWPWLRLPWLLGLILTVLTLTPWPYIHCTKSCHKNGRNSGSGCTYLGSLVSSMMTLAILTLTPWPYSYCTKSCHKNGSNSGSCCTYFGSLVSSTMTLAVLTWTPWLYSYCTKSCHKNGRNGSSGCTYLGSLGSSTMALVAIALVPWEVYQHLIVPVCGLNSQGAKVSNNICLYHYCCH